MLTDTILDAARLRGDALADATVATIFTAGDTPAVARLLGTLMRDGPPSTFATASADKPDELAAPVLAYFAQTGTVVARAPASAAAGERVFAEYGPEIMMLLCCSSLPSSYAAKKGVQVLHRTAYLAKRPNRRLFETAQFVVNVMTPGGLGPNGAGMISAQKVRLMHAAIRHLIRVDTTDPWSIDELGVPINQEDLLGTLMTFTTLILDGLAKIGVTLDAEVQQAYVETWRVVGALMGIEPDLLPRTVADAASATALIEQRQVAESPQGREMMASLLGMMQDNMPPELHGIPSCLIREFLPADVATFMGVGSFPVEQMMLGMADELLRPLQDLESMEARRHVLIRGWSLRMLRWMLSVELDGQPARFAIPDALHEDWHLAPDDSEESFWEKLKQRCG